MMMILPADNQEQVKAVIGQIIDRGGNLKFALIRQENFVKIVSEDNLDELITIEEKISSLEKSLFNLHKGALYKAVLGVVERILFENVLERTEGNQLKAARILGVNRNTMRTKIKKLGINVERWKTIL